MDVAFAFICDYADAPPGGKLNALGIGFDTIYAAQTPVRHRLFFLVAKLSANVTEVGEKSLKVSLIDADGKDVIPSITRPINIQPPPSGTETQANIAVGFEGVTFPRYGTYSLHIVIDGHEMFHIPLRVAPPPATH